VQSPVNVFEAVVQPLDFRQMFEGTVTFHANAGIATIVRRPRATTSKPVRRYLPDRLDRPCTEIGALCFGSIFRRGEGYLHANEVLIHRNSHGAQPRNITVSAVPEALYIVACKRGQRETGMLSEERFSSCIEGLAQLGVVERVEGEDRAGERLRLHLETDGVLGRILGGEMGEPPKGDELMPWFSCMILQSVLDRKGVIVSKEEFTAMAAVITGFLSQAEFTLRAKARDDRPVIGQRPGKHERK
jgi:hypothetical protein